jgi:hypothetical protein
MISEYKLGSVEVYGSTPAEKTEITALGIRLTDHATPLSAKVGTNFAYKQRSFED